MDAEMTNAKNKHHRHQEDQDMADEETAAGAGAHDSQQYDQQYDENYDQQYEAGEEGADDIYEEQATAEGEYEQDPNGVVYENDEAADAAAVAVASAVAAAAAGTPGDQEYSEEQHQGDAGEEYADQQHEGEYVDDPNAQQYVDEEQGDEQGDMVDDQTLASHPATSREMEVAESMVVDSEHNPNGIGSEVAQAIDRYDYTSHNPDGLETLAATSSAVTQHGNSLETPSKDSLHHDPLGSSLHMYSSQKPIMPKFNRSRNWSTEETKILLAELERIATSQPDERREAVLRTHTTFEDIAEVLREKGYSNREGQGCMIRWRNLLRVYKQLRMSAAEGNPQTNHPNLQYAPAIEAIYHFPPESAHFQMHGPISPGMDGTPSGLTRTWSQVNGSYETPARKRAREFNMMAENIDNIDQKLEQAMEYITQQNDMLRLLEERLGRTEDALKQSEATISKLNTSFGEKDAKREKLEHQLLATVQALSQVITKKKAEE
ncbi:hypothetical protein GGI23_000348 [Coemansia sp. RSA 2559]|nr:hypothetical protein GGI23_000348 [Coemansia sp. RSA 2559]KAJ2869321.1 hypothetical protein GGI22_000326 [Coemansia erecta]